jgi:hypothetical protein
MAITWATLRSQIQTLLASVETAVADADLLIYANWALDDLVKHVARPSDVDYEGDGTTRVFALPDDLYEITVIEWASGEYALEYTPVPGVELPTAAYAAPAYWHNNGKLTWNTAPTTSFTVYYNAYYARITDGGDSIPIPRWAEQAAAFYSGYLVLVSQSTESADIGQWDQKMDSGNPEHNPLARTAERWLRQYQRIIAQNAQQFTIPIWSSS